MASLLLFILSNPGLYLLNIVVIRFFLVSMIQAPGLFIRINNLRYNLFSLINILGLLDSCTDMISERCDKRSISSHQDGKNGLERE